MFLFDFPNLKDELTAEKSKTKSLQYEMEKCISDLQLM
jgi:hypothetical protein